MGLPAIFMAIKPTHNYMVCSNLDERQGTLPTVLLKFSLCALQQPFLFLKCHARHFLPSRSCQFWRNELAYYSNAAIQSKRKAKPTLTNDGVTC